MLLGMTGPARAQEEPPPERVYRAPADSPYQVRFNRDIDFSVIPRSVGEDDLYWGDGESDCDNFALLWDETEFHSHVDAGETEFIMTGT